MVLCCNKSAKLEETNMKAQLVSGLESNNSVGVGQKVLVAIGQPQHFFSHQPSDRMCLFYLGQLGSFFLFFGSCMRRSKNSAA